MMQHSHVLDGPSVPGPEITENSNPHRMRVTVVFTTIEGTIAALETAVDLAKGLAAEIVLVVTEVVYFRWRLDSPPVSRSFFEELCLGLIQEANLDADKISCEIHFCRNQIQCLEQTLRPRSLVVLGAKRRIWPIRERKLEQLLNQRGHDVLLIDSALSSAKLNAISLVCRLLDRTDLKQKHL